MESSREALLPGGVVNARLFDAICIIAGTSIGGGILALPTVAGPIGFVPCVFGLFVIWFLLAFTACVLAEACAQELVESSTKLAGDTNQGAKCISIFSVTRHAFGTYIGTICSVAFVAQMFATVTAQVAKCGEILEAMVGLPYVLGCVLPSVSVALLTCTSSHVRRAELLNSALAIIMFSGFVALVASTVYGLGVTNMSAEAMLNRMKFCDWKMLSPFQAGDAWAVPVLLNMISFGQSVPFVVQRLDIRRSQGILTAIVGGSGIPVVICIVWAFISTVMTDQQQGVQTHEVDPILEMLNAKPLVSVPLACFAGGAIGTTLIASYLALQQFGRDCMYAFRGSCSASDLRAVAAFVVFVTSGLACSGPGMYLPLLAFSGAFPSTMLYVIAPPMAVLTLRRRKQPHLYAAFESYFQAPLGYAPVMICTILIGVGIVAASSWSLL
eukprot:TRINITY_DN18911_c0_g1_i1.p1 TRINITY_DN18911_c0_g1~~TRINITY_DN18911_c0_g1_i1.p1  ORF type:complete len:441 (+),score=28.07 TRINITY_DN18911_c0_g1_i1:73-1395(+)